MQQKRPKQFNLSEEEDYRFRMRYSRFKIWVSKKDGTNSTYYAIEASCTIRQIMYRKVNEFYFDRRKGLEECIRMAEKTFKGKYITAIIYDRHHHKENGKWVEAEVMKYIDGNLTEYEEINFTPTTELQYVRVVHLPDNTWKLERMPDPTQFKQLVDNAVNAKQDNK